MGDANHLPKLHSAAMVRDSNRLLEDRLKQCDTTWEEVEEVSFNLITQSWPLLESLGNNLSYSDLTPLKKVYVRPDESAEERRIRETPEEQRDRLETETKIRRMIQRARKTILGKREPLYLAQCSIALDRIGEPTTYKILIKLGVPPKKAHQIQKRIDFFTKKLFPGSSLHHLLRTDENLFGPDEIHGAAMAWKYGPLAVLFFGFLDSFKLGCIRKIDKGPGCHVFLDDFICGLAAAMATKVIYELLFTEEIIDLIFGQIHQALEKDLALHNSSLWKAAHWIQKYELPYVDNKKDLTVEKVYEEILNTLRKHDIISQYVMSLAIQKGSNHDEFFLARNFPMFTPVGVAMTTGQIAGTIGGSTPGYIIQTNPFQIEDPMLRFFMGTLSSATLGRLAHSDRDLSEESHPENFLVDNRNIFERVIFWGRAA